ncbi:M14 family metallopeptidase [Thalassotalea piscium]
MTKMPYPIGLPGIKWGAEEKQSWLAKQSVKRSYLDDVVSQINQLANAFDIEQYGALSYEHNHYPLFVLKSLQWDDNKPTVLITGGVHGYETSGVQGALRFSATQSSHYQSHFNFLVVPCVSPWGYETINRWNPKAIDPNRSFYPQSPAEEAALLMKYISGFNINVHIDLHETTDTDNSEFRPALAARDAVTHDNWNIPDGFYLVADTTKPMPDFQQAVIQAVEKVTHIAPADDNNKLIGETVQQWGVINYAARDLGLCMGLTDAEYVTTTEVYPDSPRSDDENCILAQVAAVTGALNFVIDQG